VYQKKTITCIQTNIITYIMQTTKTERYLTYYSCYRHEVRSNVNMLYAFAHYSKRAHDLMKGMSIVNGLIRAYIKRMLYSRVSTYIQL